MNRIRVLYIVGAGRSGSTLLGRILGEVPGFVHVGEAALYLFSNVHQNPKVLCGCGQPMESCQFWKSVLPRITKRSDEIPLDLGRHLFFPHIVLRHTAGNFQVKRYDGKFERSVNIFTRQSVHLYQAIAETAQHDVIVEGSKTPNFPILLSGVDNIDIYAVHLVRDPRGFMYSRYRPKAHIRALSPLQAILVWNARNLTSLYLKIILGNRYKVIKFEDFVASPTEYTNQVVRWVVGEERAIPLDGRKARLGVQHNLGGNPDKFQVGEVLIQRPRWNLPKPLSVFTRILTMPVAILLGFAIWAQCKMEARVIQGE